MSLRRLATLALTAAPLLLAAVTLLVSALAPYSDHAPLLLAALLGLVAIPLLLALAARGRGAGTLALHIVVAPALLAPLAVAFPWTAAPSHLGIGFVGFPFFLGWLTRYPNLGPVNSEVLLGILCVLGCAFLPWLAAVLRLHRPSGRTAGAALLGLTLIPYLPVLLRLDLLLLTFGILAPPGPFQSAPPIWVVFGPMLRLAAVVSTMGMLFTGRLTSPEPESAS